MKTQSRAIASTLCVLFTGFAATDAGKDTIEVTEGGVTFMVDHYDDDRNKPYKVSWNDPEDGFSSTFKFNTDGAVTDIKADGDQYKVKYKSNVDLKKVTRTTSRRNLAEEGDNVAEVVDGNDFTHIDGRRRLYDCGDCEDAWDMLVDNGVPSVWDLNGYGDPFLDSAATAIGVFCDEFGFVSPEEACEGQCDACPAPLTIALEWFDDTDLDLYVVEPVAGDRIFFNHPVGRFGYLDQDSRSGQEDGPEQYTVYGGFPPSKSESFSEEHPQGEYWVVVRSTNEEYVPFHLTATTGSGNVILDVEDTFDPDCEGEEVAHFFSVYLDEYVDNDCDLPDLAAIAEVSAVEGDKSAKDHGRK